MKRKLFKASLWLVLVLFYTNVNAQAEPNLTMVNTDTNDVTVTNLGNVSIDITNYWVCLGPGQYRQLSALTTVTGDYMLSPDESVTFDFPLIEGENADGAGGLGLFSTNSFGSTNPSIFVDYMQWGAPNQDRSGQAVTAGIWSSATEFISCPTPYETDNDGGNPTAWGDADAGVIGIDVDATNVLNVNGTTVIDSEFQVSICVDGRPDPIVVFHDTPITDRSYLYVITDATTDVILNIVGTDEISLDGAGPGTCQIWGWSYSGLNGGVDFIGGPLQALRDADCSDVSDQAITIVREAADGGTVSIDLDATGNPNGTTTFNGDTEAVICVDGQMDPIVVIHENPGAENLSYRYVITDAATGLILNVVATNSISLDPAGPGTCEIWGWSYRGVPGNGLDQIGEPLSALDDLDCSDISDNAITVIREAADGGTVSIDLDATGNPNGTTTFNGDTEAVICVDGQMDPIVVVHENPGAENLSYRYVITDAATGLILNVVATNSISLDPAGPGTCEIWGWSYRGVPGNGLDQIGEPLSSLDDLDCSDISDNAITVIREAADGGTVSIDLDATGNPNGTTTFNGDTEAVICVDGQMDPIVVVHENPGAENLSYRYVITDAATGLILNVVATNAISLDPAGPGTCEIWGWSYRGVPGNGLDQIGEPLSALDDLDCSDISDNAITVIREAADGGTVSIDIDETEAAGGSAIINSNTEAVICLDSVADPIIVTHVNESPNLSYRYVITDAATGLILNVVATNSIDLNGVEAGTCEIWGWSYRGVPGNGLDQIGEPLSALDDLDCSDISDNAVTIIRQEVTFDSEISIDLDATGNPNETTTFDDEFAAVICGDSQADPLVINVETTATELPYHLVVYDIDTLIITDIIPVFEGSAIVDLNGAVNATFEIIGVEGILPIDPADSIGNDINDFADIVFDTECIEFSLTTVLVFREVADGGIVSIDEVATEATGESTTIVTGSNSVTILVGDGVPNPVVVQHVNDAPNLSFRYVITDADTGLILNVVNTNSIDLEGAGLGVCEIWGWSYRGVPGNGLDQIGQPLSALDDLDCSDISDNAIEVIRTDVLSVGDDQIRVDVSVFPNPTTDVVNISLAGLNSTYTVNLYSITGQLVKSDTYTAQENRLQVSDLTNGIYLLEVIDVNSNTKTVRRIIKK